MKSFEPFVITVSVQTDQGRDELLYTPSHLFVDTVYEAGLAFDLGSHITDGKWHTVTRDLNEDIKKGRPDARILGIEAFRILGSGRIDDIKIGTNFQETFDRESFAKHIRGTYGWSTVEDDPCPGQIRRVYDDQRESYVIELATPRLLSRYAYKFDKGDSLKNGDDLVVQWSMKCSEPFVITIPVQTNQGPEELLYTPSHLFIDTVYEADLAFDLGPDLTDGKWHTVRRNLLADLRKGKPGTDILGVSHLLFSGSGKIGDIRVGEHFHETFDNHVLIPVIEKLLNKIDSGRMQIWKRSLGYWLGKPLTGIGLGSFRHMPNETTYHAHNFLFNVLVEQGLIGFSFLLAFMAALLWDMKSWVGTALLGSFFFSQFFDDLTPDFSFPIYTSFILGYCLFLVLSRRGKTMGLKDE